MDFRVDVIANLLLRVNIYELEVEGYNLPVDGQNTYRYTLGYTEKTSQGLEKAMEEAFEKCFDTERFGKASLLFKELGSEISWIVR